MHKLLKRQLKKTAATVDEKFLTLINQAYVDADEDRTLLEHSLEVSSQEMRELYEKLEHSAKKQLQESKDKYEALVYELRNSYFFYAYDTSSILTYLSESIYNILGYSPEEGLGKPFKVFLNNHPMNHTIPQLAQNLFAGLTQDPHHVAFNHKDGSVRYVEINSYPVFDENDVVISVEGIARDVTIQYKTQEKLSYLSNHDPLTGIANRYNLYNKLEHIIKDSKRNKKHFTLMYIDLDKFKEVNDTLGHDSGDILLKQVVQRIQKEIRGNDVFARIGGDEFVIVLIDINKTYIHSLAEKILAVLNEPFVILNMQASISASIGLATYPDNGEDIQTLLKNADNAMYKVKDNGKNGFLHS